jgi:acyl-CoA synthetase (AMP-forming)/AMP-acid ligase II
VAAPDALDRRLADAASRHPAREALVSAGERWSFERLERSVRAGAARLRGMGIRRGDRVAVLCEPGPAAVAAIYAVLRAGAVVVPVAPAATPRRRDAILRDATPRLLLTDRPAPPAGVPALAAGALTAGDAGERPLEASAAGGGDLAALVYTSGSAGVPKGVMLTHGNLLFCSAAIAGYLGVGPADTILSVLPLSYSYGLSQLLVAVEAGARLVLEPGFAFPGRCVELLVEEEVTGLPGIPTFFALLLGLRGIDSREYPHLRFLTNAGAALPPSLLGRLRRAFPGAAVFSMYGQTECVRATYLDPAELDRRPGSVGRALDGTTAWVAREDGTRASPGEVGELVVQGPHVMAGYWPPRPGRRRDPVPTLATGDLFTADDDGFLYFRGRRDDVVKSRGEKVSPAEVEDALLRLEGVREAVVWAEPDELLGHVLEAHVAVPAPGGPGPREVLDHCRRLLEGPKIPQRVAIHRELPRTDSGKVDRLSLRSRGGI